MPPPAFRLASASHTRSYFCLPLARSMHASPNSARGSATEPCCAAAAAISPICLLPKCGVSRHQHVCRPKPPGATGKLIICALYFMHPPFRRSEVSKSMRQESDLTTALLFFLRSSFVYVLAPRYGLVAAPILEASRAVCVRHPSHPTLFLLIMMLTAVTSKPRTAHACTGLSVLELGEASWTILHGICARAPPAADVGMPPTRFARRPARCSRPASATAADSGSGVGRLSESPVRLSQVPCRRQRPS